MQSCRDIAYLSASDGLEGVHGPRRLLIRLHLLYCKHCRRHAAELPTIGRISRDTWNVASVDTATMHRLEEGILDQAFGPSDERPWDQSGDPAEPPGS